LQECEIGRGGTDALTPRRHGCNKGPSPTAERNAEERDCGLTCTRDVPLLTTAVLSVYPTALKADSVLHEEARRRGPLVGARITTFPELTDALARDLGVSACVVAPETAAVVLAHALETSTAPPALRTPRRGLLRELLRVIEELQAAYLEPGDVEALAAALPSGPARARFAEIGRVYAAYEGALARLGAVDRHGRERRVCEGLATAAAAGTRLPCLAGTERIVFAEIYDFSVLQFLIATSLIRMIGDAELVAFAHPENVDATRFVDRTWNRFVGDPSIADEVLPSFVVRGGRTGSLSAVLRGVFATTREAPAAADGSVRLVVAPSRYGEVEAAVRDVRRRLERGEPAERIALLARDLALYGDLVEDVCRRYRVPVYFRKGKPLLANGLVKACLNVLRCVVEGFPRARLEAILDADHFAAVPHRLGRVLRRAGFVAETARPLAECIAHRAETLPPERRARFLADGAAVGAVVGTLRALDRPRTIGGHAAALARALRRLGLRPVPGGAVVPASAARDARAWERLDETLRVLGGVTRRLGGGTVPLARFVALLVGALEPLEVEDPAERSGSVRALAIRDARGLDFDTVHLLGLDDGTFPAPHAENPLWPDAMKRDLNPVAAALLRRKLGARGEGLPLAGVLRTAREASLEDPFLFFLALSMAEREVVLSRPTVNEDGNPAVPSPFLDEVRRCTALVETTLDPTAVVPAAEECCELSELVGRAALARWTRRPDAPPDRLTDALVVADGELARRVNAIDARARIEERRARYFLSGASAKERFADAYVGRLGADPTPIATRLAGMSWSPSRLEALGACAFRFFAGTVLGLERDDDPEAAVGNAERGTLVHRVLEQLLRAHPRLPADIEAARALGRDVVHRLRDEASRAIRAKDPALFDVAWRQVGASVDALVVLEHREQRALAVDGVDVEYRLETPVEHVLAGAPPLRIGGRPDRVELRRRAGRLVGLRVLDYKTSRRHEKFRPLIDPERAMGTTGFQIPVYLLAAAGETPELPADAELEGGYLVLLAADKEIVRKFSRTELDSVAGNIRALVGRTTAGHFDVDPDPCDPYCAYRAVCRYQRPPLEEDAASD